MLLFGREPKLPIDIAFGLKKDDQENKTYSEYISDLQSKSTETLIKQETSKRLIMT